jgi:hypothetical protein
VLLSSTGGGVTVNPLQSSAAATIIGDDMAVTVLALDVDRGEGADGATTPFTFRVLRAGPTARPSPSATALPARSMPTTS